MKIIVQELLKIPKWRPQIEAPFMNINDLAAFKKWV